MQELAVLLHAVFGNPEEIDTDEGGPPETLTVQDVLPDPSISDAGLHETLVDVEYMVRLAVPELPPLLESPEYVPVTVTAPAVEPVVVTLQLPLERVHVVGLKVTLPTPD